MKQLNLDNKIEKRSVEERNKLKEAKRQHKKLISDAGLNPKKVLNINNVNLER